jgi:DNA-binding GntR family transcriptional regulator
VDSLDHLPALDLTRPPVAGLSEQITLMLEEAILLGKLKPGERIIEAEVAAEMGTSNGPVREALHELENLGLIMSYPRRGTFVRELNAQLAREVFSLRAVLEVSALRTVLPDLRDGDVARFQDVLAELGRYPGGPTATPRGLVNSDLRFHDILFELSTHRLLKQAWERLRVQARVLLLVTGALWNVRGKSEHERAESMHAVHKPLVDALQARDARAAERVFGEHLAEGERLLIRKFAPAEESRETLVERLLDRARVRP